MGKISKDSQLENNLHYTFKDKTLLEQALTHRSFSSSNNERLEFVGDSILNYSVAHMLFIKFPHLPEGDLSRIRASLVNQETLSEIAHEINLGHYLRLGQGELKTKGYQRPSILSDALEAIFAAISIDSDFLAAEQVIQHFYTSRINTLNPEHIKDPKSLLQEKLQAQKIALPQYTIVEQSGEAHQQLFSIECSIPELNIKTTAKANSRKKAEQKAAHLALDKINPSSSETE
ncbi:ribonuclease III [Neisseriaceae bacterium PsAf]|nr:ribonuclease III [Neisseriaceae bacterium PsAf]